MNLVVKEVKDTKDPLVPEASSRQVPSVCLGKVGRPRGFPEQCLRLLVSI